MEQMSIHIALNILEHAASFVETFITVKLF